MIFVENGTFYLESAGTSYCFKVDEEGALWHLYFGKRVPREDLSFSLSRAGRGHGVSLLGGGSPEVRAYECPLYGRGDFRESMLALDFGGVRVCDLRYDGHTVSEKSPIADMPSLRGGQTLAVSLKDDVHGTKVTLFYTVYEDLPVIARRAEIENGGNAPVLLDRAYSFSLDLPDADFDTISLFGAHMRERFPERNSLVHGTFAVDSTRGVSSAQLNPFLALARKNADEEKGEVYAFQLIYSGDFTLKAQVGQNDDVRVLGGINDYDFSWELLPGEKFSTPEAVLVRSDEGLGGMSRALHDLYRRHLIDPRYAEPPRPIVVNSWEATYFDFDTDRLLALIDGTAGTGADTFVLDDGWFGARNSDRAGLGDWFANEEKADLAKVSDHAHARGLKFGLWVEPEMVNPDSDLYRAHPDWAMHAEGLPPRLGRNQLVLDLTRAEVVDEIARRIVSVVKRYRVDYIKWDMNRSLTENCSLWLGKRGKETHHRYVLGVYRLIGLVKSACPDLFMEGCASGGCRFDPAMLAFFPQIWTSDNTDAYWRAVIQYGTSYAYPLSAQSCHVSVCPNHQCGRTTPFSARWQIAALGATGYELDPSALTEEEKREVAAQTAAYRRRERLILTGDLYRLADPRKGDLFAVMVVSKDKGEGLLTAMQTLALPNGRELRVYPRGLAGPAEYEVKELGITRRGDTLMNAGIVLPAAFGDFTATTLTFVRK